MTGPAEKPGAGEKHSGGLAQLVRWLNEERPVTGPDDVGFVGAPRRTARWTYGEPVAPLRPEPEREVLAEVRVGPAPRCAVAGETIALSVSLINTRGRMYLGWPIKLEWSSSDPSVATVSDGGIVDVHAKGRVEITCRCEGKTGSVLLTVVEPAVAAAVGLPVPAHLLRSLRSGSHAFAAPEAARAQQTTRPLPEAPAERPAPLPTQRPVEPVAERAPEPVAAPVAEPPQDLAPTLALELPPELLRDLPREVLQELPREVLAALPAVLPPAHRRSVERGAPKHGLLASLAPSRGTRRVLFRVAVGAATAAFVAVALTQSPEEYFVVGAEPPAVTAGLSKPAPAQPRRTSALRSALGLGPALPAKPARSEAAPLGDTSRGATLTQTSAGTVAEALGPARAPVAASEPAAATAPGPAAGAQPAANPVAPTPGVPSISRVVMAPSPSQLIEGESVRLSAAGVDEKGEPVAGNAVTWKSEDGEIAVVDANGVVTAKRPGTVTIVATSEGRSGRVTLTVGPRRAAAASTESGTASLSAAPAAPARESAPATAAQVMRARVEEFVQALRERNAERVAALYRAESSQDGKNLQALLERLRRPEARLKVSDPQVASSDVREMEATAEFQVPMSWTTPFGRVRSQTATFQAILEPGDGGWRLVAIRAVGKID